MANLIILDSGHAEKVSGKQSPDKSLREWDFNNQIQYKLKKRCEDHNIKVYLTNPSPKGIDEMGLTKRATLANNYWASQGKPNALFISIHANAYGSGFNDARGTETFVASNASTKSKNAASYIQAEVCNRIRAIDSKAKNRGVKTADFTVIYKANMPSILVEYAFYTNTDDLKILKNSKDDLVEATMKGICKYFNIAYKEVKKEPETPVIDSNIYYRVVVGSYKDKKNAEEMVEKLKKDGYNPFIATYKKD